MVKFKNAEMTPKQAQAKPAHDYFRDFRLCLSRLLGFWMKTEYCLSKN